MYAQIFSIIAPIIFIALLGYLWAHVDFPYDGKFVSRIVMDVGTPCLILSTMSATKLATEEITIVSMITLAGIGFLLACNCLLIGLAGVSYRTYLSPLTFANTGNMGLPICLFAFGEYGLALAMIIFMVTSMIHFSVGVSIVGSRHPLGTLARSPVFYASCLALFFVYSGTRLPESIFNTIDLLGGIAIPLMIFSLGVSLHSLHAKSFQRSLFFAAMRLLIGFSVGIAVCWIFKLEGIVRGAVLIQFAMPSAVFNYLLASNYDRDPEEVAGVVVFSTLLSFATLPFLLWYVL